MCGIAGVLRAGAEPVDGRLLSRMRDALAHRGPDAATQWIDGPIGLAHRRLSVIDTTDASSQPMVSDDGRFVLTYNGEIYNYVELREELRALGRRFRTVGDTEVLLQALEAWGEDALLRLNGMFAFALWDRRERRLLLVRDRFGEKPLFVTELPRGGVAFASEMKALLQNPEVSQQTDEQTLGQYAGGAYYEEGANTFFKAIRRHPAAGAALYDQDGALLRRWRYWTPDYTRIDEDIDERAATERFHDLLQRSVKMRLRADVKIGSSLSGGLDSSVIVGMLSGQRQAGAGFAQDTFSAHFPDDPTLSEGEYIDEVIAFNGVNGHAVAPDPLRLIEESRKLHWHQEEPFLSASIYLQWCVARLAKESACIVQLDGQGADEILGGYQYWYKFHQLDLIDRGEFDALQETTRAFTDRLSAAASRYENAGRRFNAGVAYSEQELEGLKATTQGLYAGPWTEGVPPPQPGMRLRRIMAEATQCNSLPILLRYADRNSMAFSREARLPFLDYDLADFCIGMPDRMFIARGWQKIMLREASRGYVPESVRWRADKVGYAAPLDVWMRGKLKDWCYEKAFTGPVTESPGYPAESLKTWWAQHQSGEANHSWAIWRWISLNEWLELGREGWRSGSAEAERRTPLSVTTPTPAPDFPEIAPPANGGLFGRLRGAVGRVLARD
jgi:asparagine synthase (glutamine-hydrolysing)